MGKTCGFYKNRRFLYVIKREKKKRKVDFGAYAFLIPAAVIYLSVIVVPVFYSLFIQCVVKPLVSAMGI